MCINKNNFFLILYILFSINTFSQIVDTNKIAESNLQLDITQNEQFLLQITEYPDYNNIDIQNSIIEFIYDFLIFRG